MIKRIKHMAIAVQDVDEATAAYQTLLSAGEPRRHEWEAGKSREAHFDFGEVEVQLCQSTDPEGRYAQHIASHGEGVHHMCLEVEDIDVALESALAAGATLKLCQACDVLGSHPHPEGWVAFLDGTAVPGLEIEYMQVYKDGERPAGFAEGV